MAGSGGLATEVELLFSGAMKDIRSACWAAAGREKVVFGAGLLTPVGFVPRPAILMLCVSSPTWIGVVTKMMEVPSAQVNCDELEMQ